jgi:hypothetical protein
VNTEDWNTQVSSLKELFTPLGADSAAMRVTQFSRLPQCVRGTNGKLQELLYLNPNPKHVSLREMPQRETRQSIEERMEAAHRQMREDTEPFPAITIPEGGQNGA